MSLSLKKQFEVSLSLKNAKSDVCGIDFDNTGKRVLVPCPEGELTGPDFHGTIMAGGIDHQLVRADGVTEINASYGFRLDDGRSLYIHVEGLRAVPAELVETVKAGGAVDPKQFYYVTTPKFEVYDDSLRWMTQKIFVCDAVRLPDAVLLTYYTVEQVNDHPALQ